VQSYPDAKDVTGKDLVGKAKVTALVFFNTGCSSCFAELAEASNAVKAVNDPAKLEVYAIAVDKRGALSVKAYDEGNQFAVKYLLDPEFKVPPVFGFRYTPAMVVAGKDGKIMEVRGGFDPSAEKGSVQKLLQELAK
ncbi:MAG TPA: redoxin domain-containing protein, partial [Candidatus Methanoperedens sp.]|nr:redoxin domain-containing protein [Candidatus Methanoperedens sp.]